MNFCTKFVELQRVQLNWEITQSQEAEAGVKRYILSSGPAKREKGSLVRRKYHRSLFCGQSLIFTFSTKMKKKQIKKTNFS